MKWKRRIRWIVAICLAPILLVAALLITAPFWLNQDAVKREIEQIVDSATGGRLQYDRIDLQFFPMPGAELTQVRFSLPGRVEVQTASVSIDIRLLPLFFGNVYPHRARIIAPQIKVHLDEPKPAPSTAPQTQQQTGQFSLKETDASVRSVIVQIQKAVPNLVAEIEAGKVELRIGQRPPLLVEKIDVHLDVTTKTISAKVSCNSNLWTHFGADLHSTADELSGTGHLELSGLQVASLGPILGIQDGWPVQDATVNASLDLKLRGLTDARADLRVDTPKVALQFGKAHLDFVGAAIEAAAQTKGESVEVTLGKLALDSPRVALSAKFVKSETGYALDAETGDVNLLDLQAVGQALAPEVDWLVDFPVTVASGIVTSATFKTQAVKLEDLFDLQTMHITGSVDKGDISLPVFYDLKVHQISATASIEQGVLHVRQAQGRLGKSIARDGSFDLNLIPDVMPLHLDATASVDLAEGMTVAKRVLPDPQIQGQLNQVKDLTGSASVRVVLGGDVDHITTRVEVSSLVASARHELVPFPIHIARGGLTYAGPTLTLQGLGGAIGQSTFNAVSAQLGLSSPYPLTSQQGTVVAALEELFHWASEQPRFAKQLGGIKQISGALAVSIAKLDVPLNLPEQMRFAVNATPQHIVLDAPKYGPPAKLDGGVVQVSQQSVNAKGINVSVLDANLELSGHTDNYLKSFDSVQAGASGTVGPEALKWVYAKAALPKELRLRAALNVSSSAVEWHANGNVAARGSVNVVGGPKVGFSVRSLPKRIEVETLTLHDDASDVKLDGGLEGTHFVLTYKGRLAGSSIDHIFAEPLVSLEKLEGDFHADGDIQHPDVTSANGYLRGSKIRLPPMPPMLLTIDSLSVEAKDRVLLVKSASLSSGESRVDVSGSVTYLQDKFAVDADVQGDLLVVPIKKAEEESTKRESTSQDESATPKSKEPIADIILELPISGSIRVKLGTLRVGAVAISPLEAAATLQTGHFHLQVQNAALCGIAASGVATAIPGLTQIDAKLKTRGAELDKTIACLTNERVQMTGNVDMDADFSSRGKPGTLLQYLQGTFTATAKNGWISKAESLAQVLKVINVTQAVAGKMPDLSKSGMGYDKLYIEGRIEKQTIHFEQMALDASALEVAAHGKIDYATGALNLDVLVAPLQTVNWVLSYIPGLRKIFGGTILALPVHVGGTVDKPIVVPLGVRAVGSRLIDIMSNTLKLPGELINVKPTDTGAAAPSTTKPSGQ